MATVVLAAEAETGGNLHDHLQEVVMAATGAAEQEEAAIEDTIVEEMARPGIRELVVAVMTAEATEMTTTATRSHDGDASVVSTTPTVTPHRQERRKVTR